MGEVKNNTYQFMSPEFRFMKWEIGAVTFVMGIIYLFEAENRMFILKFWGVMVILIILTYILVYFNNKLDKQVQNG